MYVFVYGTILSGMRNNHRVEGNKFIGKGKTIEKLYMSSLKSLSYPMISYEPFHSTQEITRITGEVYEIDEETLQDLDYLEGHPYFYTRQFVNVELENDSIIKAFCYIVLHPDIVEEVKNSYEKRSKAVNDGDWRRFFNENKKIIIV
jgi:gamma-glutamylaminecyclotransferase